MKPSHRILGFILIGILLLACENEQQTWLSEMEGVPVITVPAVVGIGLPVTITAGGITTPGNVAYTWYAPDFSPGTFTGATFEAIAPPEPNEYEILITAHAAGYRDVTKKGTIVVVECTPMQGLLDIQVDEINIIKEETVQFTARGITSPANESITYEWNIPGFPATYTGGAVFTTTAPTDPGAYMVSVTAKAENYCHVDTSKTILVQPGRKMRGMFNFDYSPQPAVKGQKITFTASGITTPTAEHISYEWEAPFTDGTHGGNTYTATCPTTTGDFLVKVTAKAAGYSDSTVSKLIPVGDELPMTGNISISVPPEVVVSNPVTFQLTNNITQPSTGVSFEWSAPAFTPNVFETTGNTFTATAPATEGAYTITVTAKAAKYNRATSATATVNVKGGYDMGGELDFDIPSQIVKDLAATFTINSTLTAGGSPITYEWDAPGFSPATHSGGTFTGAPGIAGSRTIILHAKADGYITKTKSKTINVTDGLDMGTLTILVNGDNDLSSFNAGISDVTFTPGLANPLLSPVTYTWDAAGCTPGSFTGAQYKPTLPSMKGNYTVTLTAQATGYHPKTATFNYNIACNPMPVDFNLTRTALLTNDETTLTATLAAPTEPSYTWTIPTGFTVTNGNLTAASVTIRAPSEGRTNPEIITLTAKAVNHCEASHTATVTVKDCYPSTYTPTITSSAIFENGAIHASNLQEVTFYTLPITPLRSGGTATYAWSINNPSGSSFTPSNSSAATGNTTFKTRAPLHSNTIYDLRLQVAADGFCLFAPVSQYVKVDSSAGKLAGTIRIVEVVAPTSDPNKPELWIANGRPITLHAQYWPGSGEALEELDLEFKWYWIDELQQKHPLNSTTSPVLTFTPSQAVSDGQIRVEVRDLNGKAGIGQSYPYTVQNCSADNLPGLHVNVNYKCGTKNLYATAYLIDSVGNNRIYPIVKIGGKWWLTENLRKENNANTQYINTYGAYYSAVFVDDLGKTDGAYCPKGWRIPKSDEWDALEDAMGGGANTEAFKGLATADIANSPAIGSVAWNKDMINNLPGLNSAGFNMIPAGVYNGNIVQATGNIAMFFVHGGSEIRTFGNMGTSAPGVAGIAGINNTYSYTARCVND